MIVPVSLTPQEERVAVKQCSDTLKIGEKWFVLSFRWWRTWCEYVDYEENGTQGEKPGPIDNADIQGTNKIDLKAGLIEKYDYVLVHAEAYQKLLGWYSGGPHFERTVINSGSSVLVNESVEVYPVLINFVYADPVTGEIPEFKSQDIVDLFTSLSLRVKSTGEAGEGDSKVQIDGLNTELVSRKSTLKDLVSKYDGVRPASEARLNPTSVGRARLRVWRQTIQNGDKVYKLMNSKALESSLDDLMLDPFEILCFEKLREDKKFPRASFEKPFRQFELWDDVDAKDKQNDWYESQIIDINDDEVHVHFKRWQDKYDQWMKKDSDNLAPCSTHTDGQYIPKAERVGTYSSVQSSSNYGVHAKFHFLSFAAVGSTYGQSVGSSYRPSYNDYSSYNNNDEGAPLQKGAVGLRNLGNTCFMNSTIQCLSNSPYLTDFFVRGFYERQINRDNPLGWKGKVADEWGKLMKDVWSGRFRVVAPRSFKQTIGEFEPRFSGYNQQDSSELLSFLVDGLHEDLNRIAKKPATTIKDYDGRPDAIIAAESWGVHKLRNDSVIVDMMQGQLKSQLLCPNCSKYSIVFDPFMHLSVPLPVVSDKSQSVTVAFLDKPAVVYGVPKLGYVKDLKKALSIQINIPVSNLAVADVFSSRIYKILNDDFSLADIRGNDDIWVYQVDFLESDSAAKFDQRPIISTIINVGKKRNPSYFPGSIYSKEFTFDAFGLPLVTVLDPLKKYTNGEIADNISSKIRPYLKATVPIEDSGLKILLLDHTGRNCGACDVSSCTGCVLSSDRDSSFEFSVNKLQFGISWENIAAYDEERIRDISRDISAPVPGRSVSASGQVSSCLLSDCFDLNSKEEILDESETWYCRNCKDHVRATKKMDIWKAPDIFVVHLKRFQYTKYWREKLDTVVDFPIEGLDMSPWILSEESKQNAIYDLYAISNHMGGLGGGHYNAYCKNLIDNKWYLCDDSSVSPVQNLSQLKGSEAYVLYYARRTPSSITASYSNL